METEVKEVDTKDVPRKLFFDTCALMNLQVNAFRERFVISQKTLEEIENIKSSGRKDQDVKYEARSLARELVKHENDYDVVMMHREIVEILDFFNLENTPDNIICASACYCNKNVEPIVFCTDDINCRTIASKIFGLKVIGSEDLHIVKDLRIYKGYKEICGNSEYINDYFAECEENGYSDWNINEYLIIENTDAKEPKDRFREMRFDGNGFVALKLPSSNFIKGKNSLQRCALDACLSKDITIVCIAGTFGSGKSFIAMQMALYLIQKKGDQSRILGVREPWGEGREVGYLKGDFEEKTDMFFKPLEQQLDGGIYELESLKMQGKLESIVPYYMKGTTYNETVILVDEAEDLSEKQLKLVGTRLGKNSKIIFSGDYKQSLVNQTHNNPLVKMCNEFKGNPKFACIYLGEDVRSETSKMFADLFENN